MNARLGFSIAAHLRPDALIIDEVLSVGDVAFQQRCIDRMFEFKRQGVAIVFVSHNLQAVANLCDSVLVLRQKSLFVGDSAHGINAYVRSLEEIEHGGNHVTITTALTHASGSTAEVIRPGDRLALRVRYQAVQAVGDFVLSFRVVRSTDQLLVYDGHFPGETFGRTALAAGECLSVDFAFRAHLTRGQYHLETHIFEIQSQTHLAWLRPAAIMTVDEHQTWGGVADLEVEPRTAS
jgi:energy-coupling factor transporter ATP-binding protein EcfA2